MVAFNKFNSFVEHVAEKVHNFETDTLKLALSNTLPVATNTIFADITEIAAGNGYTAGGVALSGRTSGQASGLYTLDASDFAPYVTATPGSIGPFRYVVLYNDTPTSPADPLIGWWDLGAATTLTVGISLSLTFDVNGILTIQ